MYPAGTLPRPCRAAGRPCPWPCQNPAGSSPTLPRPGRVPAGSATPRPAPLARSGRVGAGYIPGITASPAASRPGSRGWPGMVTVVTPQGHGGHGRRDPGPAFTRSPARSLAL